MGEESPALGSTITQSAVGLATVQADESVTTENPVEKLSNEYANMVDVMREVFKSGRTRDVPWRCNQLQALIRSFQQKHEAVTQAIQADLGGPPLRGIGDMASVGDAKHALANLEAWAKPVKLDNDIPIDFQSSFQVRPEPKGVVLIIAPWNFPFNLCFQPLVAALAAGNCVVIKPSEISPHSAEVIADMVNEFFDNDCIKVVQGGIPETTALLEQRWDHVFYSGNGYVGRIVMQAAAKHLTPVTLELGGKNPVIADKTVNMATLVNRVFFAKTQNQGQACIAPDYLLIDESRKREFLAEFIKQVRISNFGAGSKDNPNWGKIISPRHVERLKKLIDTSEGRVLCGGSSDIDLAARHVPLTVITDVALESPIMNEEIFGPILPVISVKNMEDAIKVVQSLEVPLALYVFSEDKLFQEYVLQACRSGGAAVNTAFEHVANMQAPFGGIGGSGMGKYHGKYGFDELSHMRTVLKKSGSQPAIPPSEQQPSWLYDVALKSQVTGFS